MKAKEQMYVQCNLRREVAGEIKVDTAYIPIQFAVKGKFLEINGEDHWQVMNDIHPTDVPRSGEFLIQRHRSVKQTRIASDI